MKLLLKPAIAAPLIGIVVTLCLLMIRAAGYLEPWELGAYDWSLKLQPIPATSESRLVRIDISEDDIQKLGSWPLTDQTLERMLGRLLSEKPRAVGVDIYRDLPVPHGQDRLKATLLAHPNVIMVMKFGQHPRAKVGAPAVLKDKPDRIGFNDLLVDGDGVVRRGLLFLDDGHEVDYSFALRLALLYLQNEGVVPQSDPLVPTHLRLGGTTLRPLQSGDGGYTHADFSGYQILLDYQGGRRPFRSYPLTDLLAGTVPSAAIRDKVVLVGVTAVSVPDVFQTPYSSTETGEQRGIYGVLVHTEMVSQLLRAALDGDSPVKTLTEFQEMNWILLWGILGGFIGILGRTAWRFVVFTSAGLIVLALVVYFAMLEKWWIPLFPPAVGWACSAALLTAYMTNVEKKQRRLVMQLFSRHVSPEIAEAIWREREQFWEGSRPRSQHVTITVLFTDLEGFTPVSEKLSPQALMDWINAYIDTMAQLVMKHGGVVDDYFGDAIKANFGVPLPRSSEEEIRRDAVHAVACALDMSDEMHQLNATWQRQGLPQVRMRVGIFTGPAVAGSLGTAQRLKYTTIGDTVNIAARLESFDKDAWDSADGDPYCRILIGESTLQYVGPEFRSRRVGDLTLKGKYEKVSVYQVLGRGEPSA